MKISCIAALCLTLAGCASMGAGGDQPNDMTYRASADSPAAVG